MRIELYYDEPIRMLEIIKEDSKEYEWKKQYMNIINEQIKENTPKSTGVLIYTPNDVKIRKYQEFFEERKKWEQGFEFNYDYTGYRKIIDKYTCRKE